MFAIGRIVVIVCILAGAALIALGVVRENSENAFLSKAAKALGEVKEIQTRPIDEQTNDYCAVVSFSPPTGTPVSFVNPDCGAVQQQRIGDKVPVLYDPAAPTTARISEGTGPWAVALPFFGWAALSLLAAIVAALVFSRLTR